jgi:hypothetical protein
MNRAFRTFMLWLLVMAIPVQGFAAATMSSCGSFHAAPWAASHEDASKHRHMHHHEADAHDDHASPGHGKLATSSCSDCAACCIGTAVLPSVLAWAPFHGRSEPVIVAPPSFAACHIPATPERPPRGLSL